MKKILFIFATVLLVSTMLVSCSKDDNEGYSIVGVWQRMPDFWIYEFRTDNTWYYYGTENYYKKNDYTRNGHYSFDGTNLILDSGFKQPVTFSEDGNEIIWKDEYYKRIK